MSRINQIDVNVQKRIDLIKESILDVVPDTEAIYLFGSYVYGTPHKDSDLDIYVVIPDKIMDNPLDVSVDIRMNLLDKDMDMPMDLLVGKRSVFNRRKELAGTIQKTIAMKGVQLYGAGQRI